VSTQRLAAQAAEKRALLVADEKVSGARLVRSVIDHLGPGVDEVFVVAPALADSALDHIMGDVDAAIPATRATRKGASAPKRRRRS